MQQPTEKQPFTSNLSEQVS